MFHEFEALDDLWGAEWEESDGVLYRRLFQYNRSAILEQNNRLRASGVVRDRPFLGRWCLSIPEEDLRVLKRSPKWRGLGSLDPKERTETWRKFMLDPASAPYRVRDKAC